MVIKRTRMVFERRILETCPRTAVILFKWPTKSKALPFGTEILGQYSTGYLHLNEAKRN